MYKVLDIKELIRTLQNLYCKDIFRVNEIELMQFLNCKYKTDFAVITDNKKQVITVKDIGLTYHAMYYDIKESRENSYAK